MRKFTWTVPSTVTLRFHTWDEETIVYHCQSGDAHLLNPVAAAALKILLEGPITETDLSARLADDLDLETAPELSCQIQTLLQKFDELGLIWPA